jgi:hypothetical protein
MLKLSEIGDCASVTYQGLLALTAIVKRRAANESNAHSTPDAWDAAIKMVIRR